MVRGGRGRGSGEETTKEEVSGFSANFLPIGAPVAFHMDLAFLA